MSGEASSAEASQLVPETVPVVETSRKRKRLAVEATERAVMLLLNDYQAFVVRKREQGFSNFDSDKTVEDRVHRAVNAIRSYAEVKQRLPRLPVKLWNK